MRSRIVVVVVLVGLLLVGSPHPGFAAVTIDRAELRDGDLRVEGEDAVANARILIDGVDLGRADDRGRFRIEVSGFSSPTCRITVDDGTGPVETDLDRCTSSEPEDPEPEPDDPEPDDPEPDDPEPDDPEPDDPEPDDPEPDDPEPDDPEPDEPEGPRISGVILSPTSVTAGDTSTGTALLSGPAPSGGTSVTIASSDPAIAAVPGSLTVPAGGTAGSFTVTTADVTATSTVTISTTAGGVTEEATLTVTPAGVTVASLTLSPSLVSSGETAEGTVTLSGPAPSGGAPVALGSSITARATVPAEVTVPAGETAAAFPVSARTVETSGSTIISASYGGATLTASLTVIPGADVLASVTIEPNQQVIGGETVQGTVTLAAPQDGDTVVSLTSTDTSVATVPGSITVPAGDDSAGFPVTTHPVASSGFAVITASVGEETRSASIHTQAGPSDDAPALASVSFAPATVGGGGASTGTVLLDATATDGALIDLTSSHPDIVQVPAEVVVSANTSSVAFPVTTQVVAGTSEVTVTASARCCGASGTRTGTITVTTDAPPEPDTVQFTRARLKACILEVRATGTNPDAILTVHLASSGSQILRLTNLGDGRYEGERAFRPAGTNVPVDLTLRSNFGGSDTATVSDPQAFRCRADL